MSSNKWNGPSSTVTTTKTTAVAPSESTGSSCGDTIQNEGEVPSEYSETISILSFSDTDEELHEIESKVYIDGPEGKEEAYKDIEKVFDELENEKLLDPFTRWRPKEDPTDRLQKSSKFVPKRPSALPHRVSFECTEHCNAKTRPVSLKKPIESSKTNVPTANVSAGSSGVSLSSGSGFLPTISQAIGPNKLTTHKPMRINKISESLVSPRKAVMVELIMEASAEENTKKKKEAFKEEAKKQVSSISTISRFGTDSSKGMTKNLKSFGLNQIASFTSSPLTEDLSTSSSDIVREPPLSRQEELIQELAQSKDTNKKNKNFDEIYVFDKDGGRKDSADKTVYKIQYKEPRWPHQVTLDKMVDRLYRVKVLILDESQITSLRDISSLLPSLLVLSVKSCGLKTLDGTLSFPNLQKLNASDNLLKHPAQCSMLTELQELDLSGNPIESLKQGFDFLSVLNFLRVMKLYDTKVAENKNFHTELRLLIPSLRDIYPKAKSQQYDDFDFDEYLEEDYQLLGTTREEMAHEQQQKGQKSTHRTTMITNTTTPPQTSSSRRSQMLTPDTTDGSIITTVDDKDLVLKSVRSMEESTEKTTMDVNNINNVPENNKPPDLDNLKHIYQYVNAAAAGKSDADSVLNKKADDDGSTTDFDRVSMEYNNNSTHWSVVEGEFDDDSDVEEPHQLDDAGDKAL